MDSPSELNFDKYDEPRLHMECLMRTHLIEFDLPIRILLPLEAAGITRLGQLVKQTRKSLMQIKQIGKLSLEKLERLLNHLGFELADE